MNHVEVVGGTKFQKDLAVKVVGWYLKKMLPRYRTLDITINLTKCMEKSGAYGYCMEGDNNRQFEIEVDKTLRLYDFVSTLTHELTHMKQYAKGEMKYLNDGRTRWKKKIYGDNTDYADQPWEKEAFRVEKQLALECFESVL
jgi:hypothetical protein